MRYLIACLIVISLSGCAAWQRTFCKEDLVKLSPGMSKECVLMNLGGTANPIAYENKAGHAYEILEVVDKPVYVGRPNPAFWVRYWIYLQDGKYTGYRIASEANAVAANQATQQQIADAAAFSSMKGTPFMPLSVNQNTNVQHSGTVNQNINADVRVR